MQEARPHKLRGALESEKSLAGAIRELVFGAEDGLVTGVAAGTTSKMVQEFSAYSMRRAAPARPWRRSRGRTARIAD